jgi:hypothetical protein
MYTHGPSCLEGPASRTFLRWSQLTRGLHGRFRTELVERVRREIAEGTYDTPEKWEIALDRLLDAIENDRFTS